MSNNVFKQHPRLESYHETSDGIKFFTESNAKNHAKSLKDKKVKVVERSEENDAPKKDTEPKASNPMQAAKLRVDEINALQRVEEIEKALEGETAKSVKKAAADRIAAIQATDALNSAENENVQNS